MPKPGDDQEVMVKIGIAAEYSAIELSNVVSELSRFGFQEISRDVNMVCVTGSIPSQKVGLIEEIDGVSWVQRV